MTNRIASVILQQLGGNRFIAMTGAASLLAYPNGLQMDIPRRLCINKASRCTVTLATNDTYTVVFGVLRGVEYRVISTHEGILVGELRKLFKEQTGLDVKL